MLFEIPRTQGAITLAVVNAGCLWWWTWPQMLLAFYFGFPFFPYSPKLALEGYYSPVPSYPWNLPELFLGMTIFWIFVLWAGVPIYLKGSAVKARPLILLSIFTAIALGFSIMMVKGESIQYEQAFSEHWRNHLWGKSQNEGLERAIHGYEASRGLPLTNFTDLSNSYNPR